MENVCFIYFSFFLMFISYGALLGILSAIISKSNLTEKAKFEDIYYASKILTIKNIVLTNHKSEVLLDFSPSGEPIGLTTSYKNLLKLAQNKKCEENYRPCGILDTYGNLLCIDESFSCPINKYEVDLISKSNNYLSQNYKTVPLSNLTYNYQFFFANFFPEGIIGVIIIKDEDEPKYLTKNNFVVDYELYKEHFGDLKSIEDLASVFDNSNDIKIINDDAEVKDSIKTVVQLLQSGDNNGDIDTDLIGFGVKAFLVFFTEDYNKRLERFKKYVEEKIDENEEENIDKYIKHIGDNFYVKNYIGFKSPEDINKFTKFNYNIIKRTFPNIKATSFAIIGICLIGLTLISILSCIFGSKEIREKLENLEHLANPLVRILIDLLVFYPYAIGFIIYSEYSYSQFNKNEKLNDLKSIESDEFIKNFIKEFINRCQEKYSIRIYTIIIIGSASFLNLVSFIIILILSLNKKFNTTNNNNNK